MILLILSVRVGKHECIIVFLIEHLLKMAMRRFCISLALYIGNVRRRIMRAYNRVFKEYPAMQAAAVLNVPANDTLQLVAGQAEQ